MRIGMCADQSSLDVKVEILGRLADRGYVASDLCFSYPDWKHQSDVIGELARAIADRSIDHGILSLLRCPRRFCERKQISKDTRSCRAPEIIADDPARTKIIGNFRMSYQGRPINCNNYRWYARVFNKPHHEIENDLRVRDENFKDGARPEHYGKLTRH